MKILVVAKTYPSLQKPNYGAFVYNLVQELARQNNEIMVISPMKMTDFLKKGHISYGEEQCKVYRPLYFSFSNKKILGIKIGKLTSYLYKKAIHRILKKLQKPDVIYTHFLSNALPVLNYATEKGIHLVIASGESTFTSWEKKSENVKTALKNKVNHIICVSNENRNQLIELGFNPNKMSVIPNAVNYDIFKPLDKRVCKEKLGLSLNKFTVGFIGHFINRKGPNRIIAAIKSLDDEGIQLICIGGSKEQLTTNTFTKVMGPVPNHKLPEVFNAFDIFVLPTLNEGHCNVIEEAKAVGIPIISSKGTSVEEQIDDSTGILVNPLDIGEIAESILKLKNDRRLYQYLKENLINRRGENSLAERASKINKVLLDLR